MDSTECEKCIIFKSNGLPMCSDCYFKKLSNEMPNELIQYNSERIFVALNNFIEFNLAEDYKKKITAIDVSPAMPQHQINADNKIATLYSFHLDNLQPNLSDNNKKGQKFKKNEYLLKIQMYYTFANYINKEFADTKDSKGRDFAGLSKTAQIYLATFSPSMFAAYDKFHDEFVKNKDYTKKKYFYFQIYVLDYVNYNIESANKITNKDYYLVIKKFFLLDVDDIENLFPVLRGKNWANPVLFTKSIHNKTLFYNFNEFMLIYRDYLAQKMLADELDKPFGEYCVVATTAMTTVATISAAATSAVALPQTLVPPIYTANQLPTVLKTNKNENTTSNVATAQKNPSTNITTWTPMNINKK